jgi:hypothetical protein
MNLRRNPTATRRRGVILLVVLAMLTLFAIAGITFVLYANAASESARISRDAETLGGSGGGPDMDPNASLNLFLNQFIYGLPDDSTGVESALRGHSLAETMYGSWDSIGTMPSDVPFNGTGRPREPGLLGATDGYNMVNYTFFTNDGNAPAPNSVLRDPSRPGTRANLMTARGTYTGGQNAPYTYADLNNMFLATIRSSDGKVLQPSYYRPWNFNTPGHTNFNDSTDPNWTSPSGKYLTLRPRPNEYGVPLPLATDPNGTTGDVKNLIGSPGGNDSIWIDIGAPVLSTASGQRYKMLVAPLILDLDRCINLNVAGNIMGAGNAHAGNQGWGPWEVNPSKVLNAAGGPNEWKNLFVGNATRSRYGAVGVLPNNGLPNSLFSLQGSSPHIYFPGDLNGLVDPMQAGAGTPTGLYNLPGVGGYAPNASFPMFPTNGYGNNAGGFLEVTVSGSGPPYNHAMFFNPLNAPSGSGNNLFSVQNNASLLWAGAATSPNSDFRQLCPTNFIAADPNTKRRILQTTPLSMDIDRGGAAPYIYDPAAAPSYGIAYTASSNTYGYGNPASTTLQSAFPPLASHVGAPPANSEFDQTTWRSVLARTLTRIDLNRPLAAYPASGIQPPDRRQFALDIFNQFLAVTGMSGVYSNIGSATPAQYTTLRWLAQLSANIVDYIDTDDVMTAFQWTTATASDTGWVFGTELPKLTLNEVYLQYQNDPTDPFTAGKATKPYQMNVWTELLNPLPSGADANGSNQAVLQNAAGTAIYQVVLTQTNSAANLRATSNVLGDPDNPAGTGSVTQSPTPLMGAGTYTTGGSKVLSVVSSFGAGQQVVTPVDSTYNVTAGVGQNNGFYVLGPSDATLTSSYQTTGAANSGTAMTYTVPLADGTAETPVAPTVLLRRLANPMLAYQPDPTAASYNPYVTVDYVDTSAVGGTVNDARTYKSSGANTATPVASRYSFGRSQPFAGASALLKKQQPANLPGVPQTTMFRHNAVEAAAPPSAGTANQTLKVPFDWLVHLDRPLISPIELLQVSGFKPHELTQQFVFNDGTPFGASFNHIAPWQDENARLYRLLEFVKAKNSMPGVMDGGRIPGKININTLDANEMEVFRALCDAQPGNRFSYDAAGTTSVGDANVDTVFSSILAARTPNLVGTDRIPGPSDQPFWGMALGAAAAGDPMGGQRGIAQTLLNPAFTNPTPGVTHPYQKMELLNKLFNNTTTRSNTFAVWLTVGFFPITNDQVQPNQLGPEINLAQGRNIRHHMFAIVDRTQIATFNTTTTGVTSSPLPLPAVSIGVAASISDPPTRTGHTWLIQPGTTLVYDPGAYHINPVAGGASPDPAQSNEETVVVLAGGKANFLYPHPSGTKVINRGHPGPMNTNFYSTTTDGLVIPYSVIID